MFLTIKRLNHFLLKAISEASYKLSSLFFMKKVARCSKVLVFKLQILAKIHLMI